MKKKRNKWIKTFEERPDAQYRLFCFHFAGGGASAFKSWNNLLPRQIELCAVQLPGREDRYGEPVFTHYKEAVKNLIPEIFSLVDKPYLFFYHSMGSIIGFQLALNILQEYSFSPLHIFFSSSAAPGNKPLFKIISHLPDDQFLRELKNFGGIPLALLENSAFLKLLLPILRKDFQLIESFDYEEGTKLNCPFTIFGGRDDPSVPPEKLEGWEAATWKEVNIRLFPGGHFYFLDCLDEVIEGVLVNAPVKYCYPEMGLFSNEYIFEAI